MNIFEAAVLGLLQGATEFIPVSSSGHLIVAEKLFGLGEGNFAFDTMLNIGTLLALGIYFRKDILELVGLRGKPLNRRLLTGIAIATVPGVIAGVLFQSVAETHLRSELLVAVMLALVALFMLWVEKRATHRKSEKDIGISDSLMIGIAQTLAFIPGTSRSGITLTTGMARGLSRQAAARFSFYLAMPILGGGVLKVLLSDNVTTHIASDPTPYVIGIVASFASGYAAIAYLLGFVEKHSLVGFAYYRLALAAIIGGIALLT